MQCYCNGCNEHFSPTTPLRLPTCESDIVCEGVIDKPTCLCDDGYVRDNKTQICVKCPPKLICEGEHEHLSKTTPCYADQCFKIKCDCLIAKESCQCDDGYTRNLKTGKCVKCPLVCDGGNEHYSKTTPCCGNPCKGITCKCIRNEESCQCDSGYFRNNRTGKCDKCP